MLNGQKKCELFHVGNGKYESQNCFPSTENHYNLTVSSQKYGSITASSSLPKKANYTIAKIDTTGGSTTIDFSIEKNSDINNYYIWDLVDVTFYKKIIVEENPGPGSRINMKKWVKNLSSNAIFIKNKSLSSNLSVSGDSFQNGSFNTSLSADKSIINNAVVVDSTVYEVKTMLRIMTVSEELFHYFKSIEDYISYEDFKTSFNEPTTVYSNIDGGVGIFAGYTVEYLDIQ